MQLDPLLKLSCAIARNRDKIEFDLVCEFEFELVFKFGASASGSCQFAQDISLRVAL